MPRKNSHITATVQFCGAGGSSQGVERAGVEVKLALNHWALAIETHSANFPNTAHDCTDISACDPRRYYSTDMLITSPECKTFSPGGGNNHNKARKQLELFSKGGIDPATERSRATMWDVPRFAEYHEYPLIIVENVVEAQTTWRLFDDWLRTMHTLDYNHKCVYLNSMHCHPTPQSRDRMYVIFWKKGNKAPDLDYMPLAYSPKLGKDVNAIQTWKNSYIRHGKYKDQYVYCCPVTGDVIEPYYYSAANIIDWSNIGTRIGERSKPLSINTLKRVDYGRNKYNDFPFIIKQSNTSCGEGSYVYPVSDVIGTQATWQDLAIATPKGKKLDHFIAAYNNGSHCTKHISEAFGTFPTRDRMSLISFDKNDIDINDYYFRMLKANEVKLGMGFNEDYVIKGNSKEQVHQLGNAVTPPVMDWIVQQVVNSLN